MTKTIYTLWVKIELAKLGFLPLDERQNPKNRELSCWDYENTQAFQTALTYVMKNRNVL